MKDIETLLSSLTLPLQVVHTVDPAEVALNLCLDCILQTQTKQAEYLNNPRLQIVPSKLVFTVKPPDQGAAVVGDASTGRVPKSRAVPSEV